MTNGHFGKGYWKFLKDIQANGGAPCEEQPQFFFPEDIPNPTERADAISQAVEICGKCVILNSCFDYAIKSNQRFGIWGGTLASER